MVPGYRPRMPQIRDWGYFLRDCWWAAWPAGRPFARAQCGVLPQSTPAKLPKQP